MFSVGQRVVCVDNRTDDGRYWIVGEEPCINTIYTIIAATVDDDGDEVVQLYELKRVSLLYKWYAASRFRPIVERKTDISSLKALLVPGAKISEPA